MSDKSSNYQYAQKYINTLGLFISEEPAQDGNFLVSDITGTLSLEKIIEFHRKAPKGTDVMIDGTFKVSIPTGKGKPKSQSYPLLSSTPFQIFMFLILVILIHSYLSTPQAI